MRNKTKELHVANVCKNREEKFNQIVPGKTKVVITKGKNKNKIGTVIKTSAIKNNRYCGGKYRNFFIVSVSINGKSIVTGCDNIMFIDCNREIERKFLVKSLPNLDKCTKDKILQGYISKSPEVRVRQKGSLYFLTIKSQGTLNRKEFETLITLSHFETLWYNFIEEYISKTRYYIRLNQQSIAELDIYHKKLDGLTTVEMEFKSEEEANNFTPPDWFGREVTYDSRYKNKNLAVNELPSGIL